MDNVHLHLLGRKLDERIGEGLDRTVHIGLEHDVEFLEVADGDTAADFLEGDVLGGLDALDTDELLALVGDVLGLFLVVEHVEVVTCGGSTVQTEHRYGSRRPCGVDLLAALVEHSLDLTGIAAAEHHVADVKGTALDHNRGEIAAALVERRLDDAADGILVGIGLEFEQVCLEQHLVKQLVDVDAFLG